MYHKHYQADTLFQIKRLNFLFNSIFKTIFNIVFILKNIIYLILVRGIKMKLTLFCFKKIQNQPSVLQEYLFLLVFNHGL